MSALFEEIAADTTPKGMVLGHRARLAWMSLFAVIAALAAIGFFGQRLTESTATAPAATLRLASPNVVRGGLFFQSRVEIRAQRAIEHPRLVLADGWLERMQFNTLEPAPMSEASRDGRLVLSYDSLERGDRLVVWMQFQVDPTNVGHRSYDLELDAGDTAIARVERAITVLP